MEKKLSNKLCPRLKKVFLQAADDENLAKQKLSIIFTAASGFETSVLTYNTIIDGIYTAEATIEEIDALIKEPKLESVRIEGKMRTL